MTIPSASRAATQNARVVTATFTSISKCQPQFTQRYWPLGELAVLGAVGGVADTGGVFTVVLADASGFSGIFNFSPTLILVVDKLFSDSIALTVVPFAFAIFVKVSPDLTT